MTTLLPRLDREQTLALVERSRELSVDEIAALMPERDVVTTASELGGVEMADEDLTDLRSAVLRLARDHGYPAGLADVGAFEARCAQILHEDLNISPHEASEEAVWSYITTCWLLDVAVWRWGGIGDSRRFRGDVNRNTFRRLWWRAEVFGDDFDLGRLGEDELFNIMERPTIAANRRLARALAARFLARLDFAGAADRMMLMRDACKRIVRLTPIVDFGALPDSSLRGLIDDVLVAAAERTPLRLPADHSSAPEASDCIEQVSGLAATEVDEQEVAHGAELSSDVAELARIAVGIARRAGRVTTVTLREAVPLDAADARRLLQGLVDRGELTRVGRTRGTHYVIPGAVDNAEREVADAGSTHAAEPRASDEPERGPITTLPPAVAPQAHPARIALRRLLRGG